MDRSFYVTRLSMSHNHVFQPEDLAAFSGAHGPQKAHHADDPAADSKREDLTARWFADDELKPS